MVKVILRTPAVRHEEINVSIVVVIGPPTIERGSRVADGWSGICVFFKRAIAIVVVEKVMACTFVDKKKAKKPVFIVARPGTANEVSDVAHNVACHDLRK